MTTPTATTREIRRLPRSRITRVLLALAVTAVSLGMFAPGANAGMANRCVPTSLHAPIVGSWYAQVHFPDQPFPGMTEATMITFTPGGGIVEANPINPSPAANSGFWQRNRDCSYSVRLMLFTWDPETTGLEELADIRLRFVMDDLNNFHSTSAAATVHLFDPQTGQRLVDPIDIPDISQTVGERFSTWTVPDSFPPQP